MEFSKRALKKAKTRLDILNAIYSLSRETNFRELKVKAIAKEAKVTEMTFFNYFPKKEDTLKYMMGLWALDLAVKQHQDPLIGEEAIRRIFHHTALEVKQHPTLMVSFISYLVTNEIDPNPNEIGAEDRYLLYPDLPEIYEAEIPNGNEMLMKHLHEMNPDADHMATLLHLASCVYGDVLVAHTANLDIEMLYTNSLNLILQQV